jgi:class 3 adenylate cyclase/tetratricopeptide (TPR) repeat protein
MKCLQCQFENLEGAKFCNECGTRLELVCRACATANPPASKFCNECGKDLRMPAQPLPKDLSFDEKLAKIQRYLPKGLTEKILSQRDRIEGERKQVTVMFCDMEGFTALSEKLGPEAMYTLMDQVYEILIHKVHDYEGTVNELTGDGVMAIFGAPIALEDAPQRAIRSALAIHKEITRFSERVAKERDIPLIRMRVGIHSGPVVVGTVGNDLRVDFKAVGDTVNLASRMQALAAPGATFVTQDTFKFTEGLFRFEGLGDRHVKGKEQAVRVYQVIAPSTRRSQFDVSAERGLTPFVGRERELELLSDGFARVKGSLGQAFSIVAGAGMGKSRLVYEFRKSLRNEDVLILEGHCLSYGQNVPYLPIVDLLEGNFGIEPEDTPGEVSGKVERGLQQIGARSEETLPYLLEIFSLHNGVEILKPMDPEAKRRKTLDALKEIAIRGSQVRPVVLIFEDLHWIDKTSEEAVRLLIEQIAGARVLALVTFRPEYLPPWARKSHYNQMNLNRLSDRESMGMITCLLGSDDVDKDLTRLLLEKTDGVPFFIEEFTRSMEEGNSIIRIGGSCCLNPEYAELAVPPTLYDVIMARVDRLTEEAKDVLKIASVIEREFSWSLIREIRAIPDEDLLSRLHQLQDAELLFERGVFPQVSYVFQHALTRELIQDSLLGKTRTEHHRAVGEAMERLWSGEIEEHSAVLAFHFSRAGDPDRGYRYHSLAGERAAASYANREALSHFQEAWRAIDGANVDGKTRSNRRVQAGIKMVEVMEPLGQFDETMGVLERLSQDCSALGDSRQTAKVHYWLGNTLGNLGRYNEARTHLLEALALSRDSEDLETEGDVHNYLCQLDYAQGFLWRALEHAEASVECLREVGKPSRLAWALTFRAVTICELKGVDDWGGPLEQARTWVERSGNDRARCLLHLVESRSSIKAGGYETALVSAMEGIACANKLGEGIQSIFLQSLAGQATLYAGRLEDALEMLNIGEHQCEEVKHPFGVACLLTAKAETLLRNGMTEDAMQSAEAALNFSKELDLGLVGHGALLVTAEILALQEPVDEVRIATLLEKASSLAERMDSPWHWATHLAVEARINLQMGRLELARTSYSQALSVYRRVCPEGWTEGLRLLRDGIAAFAIQGDGHVCRE